MREIKFRVWDVLNNKMLNWGDIFHLPAWEIFPGTPEQRPFNIMQYTGIKDKHGVEIYTGFFVRWGLRVYEICFDCGFYMHDLSGINPDYPITKEFKNAPDEFEVIGNIYENPEILKDRQ